MKPQPDRAASSHRLINESSPYLQATIQSCETEAGGEKSTDVMSQQSKPSLSTSGAAKAASGEARRDDETLPRHHGAKPLRALRAGARRRRCTPARGHIQPACPQPARYTAASLPHADAVRANCPPQPPESAASYRRRLAPGDREQKAWRE